MAKVAARPPLASFARKPTVIKAFVSSLFRLDPERNPPRDVARDFHHGLLADFSTVDGRRFRPRLDSRVMANCLSKIEIPRPRGRCQGIRQSRWSAVCSADPDNPRQSGGSFVRFEGGCLRGLMTASLASSDIICSRRNFKGVARDGDQRTESSLRPFTVPSGIFSRSIHLALTTKFDRACVRTRGR